MKNKKAQSEVITTVLIILLVLAAVFIVYTAVRSMVTGTTDTASNKAKCLGTNLEITSAIAGGAGTGAVTITRGAGGDVSELTPVILVNGEVKTGEFTCTPGTLLELATTGCKIKTGSSFSLVKSNNVTVGGKFGTTACDTISTPKNPEL